MRAWAICADGEDEENVQKHYWENLMEKGYFEDVAVHREYHSKEF
jgi:hypothetical protein